MRKITISFILILSFCFGNINGSLAQIVVDSPIEAPVKRHQFVLKTNPISALGGPFWIFGVIPITGEYRIFFEVATAQMQSAQIGVSYLGPSTLTGSLISNDTTGFGLSINGVRVQAMYKLFIASDNYAPQGFYFAPHISYATVKVASKFDPTDFFQGVKMNYNLLLGYQIISDGGFAFDIYTGMGYKTKSWSYSKDATNSLFDDFFGNRSSPNVTIGINFGYAF